MSRIFVKLYVVLLADILNPFWWTRARRRAHRYDVLEKVLTRYLMRYLPKNIGAADVAKKSDDKIFSMWLQGEENAPAIVRACWRSIRRNCAQELIILDEKNFGDYVRLPDFIMRRRRRGQIGNAHFADIVRVELLHQFGGIWMDATLFATAPIPKNIIAADFFMFIANKKFAWGYAGVQNFFIRGKKGDYLLNAWRAMILEYWKHETGAIDYLVHQLMFKALIENDAVAACEFEKMPHIDLENSHKLWAVRNKPFNEKMFDDVTGNSFLQKTTYRDSTNPIPGSFADKIIKMK